MALVFPLAATLLLLLVPPASTAAPADAGYQRLLSGIAEANKNAEACGGAFGCLGKPVKVELSSDVQLKGPLPQLNNNAHLIIDAKCPRAAKGHRCVIDAQGKFQVFTPTPVDRLYPISRLELNNLIFQRAVDGVIPNLWTNVIGHNLVFRNNSNGVILGVGRTAYPSQEYTSCRFNNNNGTAIVFGDSQFGLSLNTTGILIKRSIFSENVFSSNDVNGGAVRLAGFGMSVFENVKFIKNTASGSGGAVYADSTTVKFRRASFNLNKALKGKGGAVAGTSYIYNGLTVSFCSSTFANNSAPENKPSSSLFFEASVPDGFTRTPVAIAFCDTPQPPGSVFPSKDIGTVTTGSGAACARKYC